MRVPQRGDSAKGSLKWIQRAVDAKATALEAPILKRIRADIIDWRSPLAVDDYAEYRDKSFLARLDLDRLGPALEAFWPKRGPQWDALGLTAGGDVLLVEAKAHLMEMCSPPSQASTESRRIISARLDEVAVALGAASSRAPWIDYFYQLANRIAHVHFLREAGVPAWLILVNFIGDREMAGPVRQEEWEAAYQIVWHVMGLSSRKPFRHLIEVFPHVGELS